MTQFVCNPLVLFEPMNKLCMGDVSIVVFVQVSKYFLDFLKRQIWR